MKREYWRNTIILLLLMALFIAACGGNNSAEPEPTEAADTAETTDTGAEEEADAGEEPADEEEDAAVAADGEAEIRFAYYADGKEADVMQVLIDEFMAQNPGVNVILDVVPYATIDEQLPVQVETGEGPDMARITNFGAYSGKLLDLRRRERFAVQHTALHIEGLVTAGKAVDCFRQPDGVLVTESDGDRPCKPLGDGCAVAIADRDPRKRVLGYQILSACGANRATQLGDLSDVETAIVGHDRDRCPSEFLGEQLDRLFFLCSVHCSVSLRRRAYAAAFAVVESTRTPGPIVVDTAMVSMYCPLALAGLFFLRLPRTE